MLYLSNTVKTKHIRMSNTLSLWEIKAISNNKPITNNFDYISPIQCCWCSVGICDHEWKVKGKDNQDSNDNLLG